MSRTVKRQMLFWGAVFVFLVGATLHLRQMFYMAAALALLGPVSYLLSRRALDALQVARRLPARLSARERCRVTLTVTNPTLRPRGAFVVQDTLPGALQLVGPPPPLVTDLGPGEQREVSYDLQPLRRGVFSLGPVQLHAEDLLGLHMFRRQVETPGELLVYPRVVPLRDLWPRGAQFSPQSRRVRLRPGGMDPRGTREYVPGDDLRQIHWRVSAHRNRLTMVQREQAEGLNCTAVLDLSEGVHVGRGEQTTLEYGVTLAASLLARALAEGGAAGLIAAGDRDYSTPPQATAEHRWRLLEALARAHPGSRTPLVEVIQGQLGRLPRGSAVAVITPQSGPVVPLIASLLSARGWQALWFLLVAPTFDQPGAGGEESYRRLAVALRRRGQPVYLLHGGRSLEESLGRDLRAAV